ncbi:23S rRNA (uracil(1939)-C(5))-methyltransferase RlmD [Suicoccus acidiformans]|uniref:23S rRNA (Uracil(1939)-C(5))-methyltransferase RlmD n=1 Tax=Suicoccus acidiformans TaxID=2036206 RepID=A0A347WMM9_9LACT|nr:23S rRNA (uracil(1939)-C(5))-methyltransferase RlmD [Suicoccus acidiformans]AXY26336.1 23S rRNA (uracil(1939)-C(5))-methyltransferase RlmD [Suicoccus acidiformans]
MKKQYPTEVLDVRIDKLDSKGMGVAKYVHPPVTGSNGKQLKLFIPNTVPGDLVRVTVPNAKGRRKATLNFDTLLEAGPTRNPEVDTQASRAGGTPLLAMTYAGQLAYKESLVRGFIEGQGFDGQLVQPIIGMDTPTRYRNKMELTFGSRGELGMHAQGDFRTIIDMKDSILAPEIMVQAKHIVSDWQQAYQLPGYDKEAKTGLLRNLMMRYSFATKELMVVLYATDTSANYAEASQALTDRLSEQLPNLASFIWIKNTRIADKVDAEETAVLYGRDFIYDELAGYRYRLWPDTFFQPNPVQAEKMVQLAIDMAEVKEDMRVLDLFCGVGTFSLPLASRSKELAGIEIVEASIESAKRNAADNGLENTFFMASDARNGLKVLPEVWGQPDLLLLDPPRSGAGGKVMRAIGRFGTEKVVYVSCNPKTLAEDLVWLRDFGYALKVVQPVDQFPYSNHVECVVLMEKDR